MIRRAKYKVGLISISLVIGATGAAVAVGHARGAASRLQVPPGTAATSIGRLARDGVDRQQFPGAVEASLARRDPSIEGAAIESHVIKAAGSLGRQRADIWIYPTTRGSVCIAVVVAEQAGGCVQRFDRSMPVAVSVYTGSGIAPTVAGIAPDRATSVDVIVDGVSHPALRGRNVVFFESDDPSLPLDAVESVVAHFSDGTAVAQKWGPATH